MNLELIDTNELHNALCKNLGMQNYIKTFMDDAKLHLSDSAIEGLESSLHTLNLEYDIMDNIMRVLGASKEGFTTNCLEKYQVSSILKKCPCNLIA